MQYLYSTKLSCKFIRLLILFFFCFSTEVLSSAPQVVINEIHADPAAGLAGDANGDGMRHSTQDEFIELVNSGGAALDLSGWTLSDAGNTRHTFPAATNLAAGQSMVVFGGGTPTGGFAGAIVQTASSGLLSLNNSGDTVTLKDGSSNVVAEYTYGSEANDDQSISRDPDLTGSFTKHSEIAAAAGALFSPGTKVDGSAFSNSPPGNQPPVLDPVDDQTVELGETLVFTVTANDADGDSLTFFAENLPAGATFSDQNFAWTPSTVGLFEDIIFRVEDGNGGSDSDTISISVTEPIDIILNEFLADPASGSAGDANGDGTRHSTQDEFIELVNTGTAALDLSGWTVADASSIRHTFPGGTILDPEKAILIFGGGSPTGSFGGAMVQTAGSGQLSLNNGSDSIILKNSSESIILEHSYGSEAGDDQSLSRDPDLTGSFTKHGEIAAAAGALFSPGTKVDGSSFGTLPAPPNKPPELDPIDDKTIDRGDTLSFMVNATDPDGDDLTYSAENMPEGADFSGQEFFWIPQTAGTFSNIIFRVEDGNGGSDADTISIKVEEPLVPGELILNEYLRNPGSSDANNDGDTNFGDQFLEFINKSGATLDISGYKVFSDGNLVHEFAGGTMVPAGESTVVFSGGNPAGYFGLAGYNNLVFTAGSGTLNLQTNITVFEAQGWKIIDQDLSTGIGGVSACRNPEIYGDFQEHNTLGFTFGSGFSPGYHSDGAPFKSHNAFLGGQVNSGGSRVTINILSQQWDAASKEWQIKVSLTNRHEQKIYIPLYLRLRLHSAANSAVSVKNPDLSHRAGDERDGDYFVYNRFVGPDFFLVQHEESGSRSVRIGNPQNQYFEVVMEVFSLDRHALAKANSVAKAGLLLIGTKKLIIDQGKDLLNLEGAPAEFHLFPNYPNPFRQRTAIVFSIPKSLQTQISIFDILGRKINRLRNEQTGPGIHRIYWNGRDESDRALPSGVYFVHLQAGHFKAIRKVVLKR